MAYKLKKNVEAFTVVDGPFEKKEYVAGVEYEEVPPQEKHKFELVRKKPVKKPNPHPALPLEGEGKGEGEKTVKSKEKGGLDHAKHKSNT